MATENVIWPGDQGWPQAKPEDVGMSSEQLAKVPGLVDFEYKRGAVIKDGHQAFEYGLGADFIGPSWACARKAFISTLVGMAIKEDKIQGGREALLRPVNEIDTPTAKTFDSAVTLRHVLSYSSGSNPPGVEWEYSRHLSELKKILAELYGKDDASANISISALINAKILPVLGGQDWKAHHEKRENRIWWGMVSSSANLARWGYLWLNSGQWNGMQLVDPWYVQESITPTPSPSGGYPKSMSVYMDDGINGGFLIYSNKGGWWAGLPKDAFAALGGAPDGPKFMVFVCPSEKLIISAACECIPNTHNYNVGKAVKPIFDALI